MAVKYFNYPPSITGAASAEGHHYMMINSYKSTSAIASSDTIISSIGLYIPPAALTTKFTGEYSSTGFGINASSLSSRSENNGISR